MFRKQNEADWVGKHIDWSSPILTSHLHVELPFWIAAPDGAINVTIGDCTIAINYRNSVVAISRNGQIRRDKSEIAQLTTTGFPHTPEQQQELASISPHSTTKLRTFLSLPVLCHEAVFSLLESSNVSESRDAKAYTQSLAYAAIRFVNEFVNSYRSVSFDPYVYALANWDLPVWHISRSDQKLWQIEMVKYLASESLPESEQFAKAKYRVTEKQIQSATENKVPQSLEELLDAWSCFYRGQYAEAIRKIVTSIEVAIADQLANLSDFRSGRAEIDVRNHLRN
jgi:hypothetical protein